MPRLIRAVPRLRTVSGYTLRKLIGLWGTMLVSFSMMPLRLATLLGFALIGAGGVTSFYVIGEKLAGWSVPEGWPFLAIFIIMLFSVAQFLILGIVDEYLGRLYPAVNETPQAVVRKRYGLDADGGPHG